MQISGGIVFVFPHLKMQMRAEAVAGISHKTDYIALIHRLSLADVYSLKMRVKRDIIVFVQYHYVIAVAHACLVRNAVCSGQIIDRPKHPPRAVRRDLVDLGFVLNHIDALCPRPARGDIGTVGGVCAGYLIASCF